MTERAVRFGSEQNLVGVVHLPDTPRRDRPGVLFFNAGLDHRVGPKRLYVALARALVAVGYPVLRFDPAGLGESRNPGHAHRGDDDPLRPARAAASALRREACVHDLIVFGLCSGAGEAHAFALDDPAVKGVVLIDAYVYPTARFRMLYMWQRVSSLKRWKNLWRRMFKRGADQAQGTGVVLDAALEVEEFFVSPEKPDFAAELQRLIERGTQLLYLYTGDSHQWYNYQGQFARGFRDLNLDAVLREVFMPRADHTFSRSKDRVALVGELKAWLGDCHADRTMQSQQPPPANVW